MSEEEIDTGSRKRRGRPRKVVEGAPVETDSLPLAGQETDFAAFQGGEVDGESETDTRHIDDPLMTLSEFARRVNKHYTTVRRWAADGLFEYVKLPSGLLMVRTSVANTFLMGTTIKLRV